MERQGAQQEEVDPSSDSSAPFSGNRLAFWKTRRDSCAASLVWVGAEQHTWQSLRRYPGDASGCGWVPGGTLGALGSSFETSGAVGLRLSYRPALTGTA